MKLKVGNAYVSRSGRIVTIHGYNENFNYASKKYPYYGTIAGGTYIHTFSKNGRHTLWTKSSMDLIKRYKPKHRLKFKTIVKAQKLLKNIRKLLTKLYIYLSKGA